MSNNKNFIEFVKKYREKNPDLSYREAQKKAKIDYRKIKEKEQYNILKKEIKKDDYSEKKNKNRGRNYNQTQTQRNRTIININMNPNGMPSISTNQPVKTNYNVVNPLQPPIITQQQPIQSNYNIANPLKPPITKARSFPEVKTEPTNIGAPIGASFNDPKKEIQTKKLNINTDFKSKLESLFKR